MSAAQPDDDELAKIIHCGVRLLKVAPLASIGERIKVDGLWVLVTVERSTSQRDSFATPDRRLRA